MVGGFPRKEGMERKDVMSKNVSIYKSQASALEKHAAANCKVKIPCFFGLFYHPYANVINFEPIESRKLMLFLVLVLHGLLFLFCAPINQHFDLLLSAGTGCS